MAKRGNRQVFSFQGFDNAHYQQSERYAALIARLFDIAAQEAATAAAKEKYEPDKPFSFSDYPKTDAEVKRVINELADKMRAVILNGVRKEWEFACKKNDAFVQSIMDTSRLSKDRLNRYGSRNLEALKSFQERKVKGMSLSDRVWKYTEQYRQQIEHGLDVGLGEGKSAAELARDLKQNLKDPDKLFRRVRDKYGNLHLSKTAKAFHPGQGAYRSAHKNAMRLTRSEINMAYRESDWRRWQSLDFIVGYEIRRSNHEPKCKCGLCERLKGRYPKYFKWLGWHPQCRCHMIPIIQDRGSYKKQEEQDLKAALYGKPKSKVPAANAVTDFPEEFRQWVKEHEEAQMNWRSTPYFIRDNFKNGSLAEGLRYVPPQHRKIKTEQERADIQKRWNIRIAKRRYAESLRFARDEYADIPSLSALIDKIKQAIGNGLPIGSIDALMNKLDHKVKVKATWDERVENNKLGVLLDNVAAYKAQFGLSAMKTVYNAVESKLASWQHLSLKEQLKKLEFEIDWVGENKKYDTWQVAQDAYKKRFADVEKQIEKQKIEAGVNQAFTFSKSTKSVKVKQLVAEMKLLLEKDTSISELQAKANELNNAVSKLEAAKLARELKKAGKLGDGFTPDAYTQERKDKAVWCKSINESKQKLLKVADKVYATSSVSEKESVYQYTRGSGHINRPLRGYDKSWQTFKGIGNVPLNNEHPKAATRIKEIEQMISKSTYKDDIWVQRGVDKNGLLAFLGIKHISELKTCIGKVITDTAFMSCGAAKGTGFGGYILNIYCPRGTKMLYIDGRSAFAYENEMLIQRNTTFRVTKVDGMFLDLEVVAQ